MANFVKESFRFGIGLASFAKDQIEAVGHEVVDRIKRRGLDETAQGRKLVEDVKSEVRKEALKARDYVRKTVERAAREAGLASDEQIKLLNKRIAYLEAELKKAKKR